MEQCTFAGLDADRLPLPKHAPVDREKIVSRLIARLEALAECGEHCFLLCLMQSWYAVGRCQEIERHLGPGQKGSELLERQKHFAVKGSGVMRRLDINEPCLPAIKPGGEVRASAHVGVVESDPRRTWREGNTPDAARRDKWRSLFCRA